MRGGAVIKPWRGSRRRFKLISWLGPALYEFLRVGGGGTRVIESGWDRRGNSCEGQTVTLYVFMHSTAVLVLIAMAVWDPIC